MDCLMCNIIKEKDRDPFFIAELETGYAALGWHQRFKGYTLFICKTHASELHELEPAFKVKFLEEMSIVAQAVFNVYKPDKMNYELLGNGEAHLHWHLFPRVDGDMPQKGPVWWLPREEMYNDAVKPTDEERETMINEIRGEITKLLTN